MTKKLELAQKVKFVRMQSSGEPVYGEGVIVAKLIGVSKRVNYSVRELGSGTEGRPDKAWNLEAEALDGTDEQNAAYIAHHERIAALVKDYEAESAVMVKAANDRIEAAHVEFFGAPLQV